MCFYHGSASKDPHFISKIIYIYIYIYSFRQVLLNAKEYFVFHSNTRPTQDNVKIKVQIYYKSRKIHNLVMKNNLTKNDDKLKRTNVIYKYSCPDEDCLLRKTDYIGLTTTTLSRRLTMHLRDGAPHDHTTQTHHRHITRKDLTDNTSILTMCNNRRRLHVLEALFIRKEKPRLNKQITSCITLALFP